MNPTQSDVFCELCEKPATYRPQLNRTLCLAHTQELEAERGIHLYTVRHVEQIATEMLHQYQIVMSKQKIIEVIKNAAKKSLEELSSD